MYVCMYVCVYIYIYIYIRVLVRWLKVETTAVDGVCPAPAATLHLCAESCAARDDFVRRRPHEDDARKRKAL